MAEHQDGEQHHDHGHDLRPGQHSEIRLEEGSLTEGVESSQDHPGCGTGQAVEVVLRLPVLLDVESCKPGHHGGDVEEYDNPAPRPVGEVERVHDEAGGHSEGDGVDKGIQLGPEAGSGPGKAGDPSIQGVQDRREDDEPARPDQLPASYRHQGVDPEEEVAQRERRGEDNDSPLEVRLLLPARYTHSIPWDCGALEMRARDVLPTRTRSPLLQVTLHSSGMKRSTRDPKRISPMRSPISTCDPSPG